MKTTIYLLLIIFAISCTTSKSMLYDKYDHKILKKGITNKDNYTGHYFIVQNRSSNKIDTVMVSPREYKQIKIKNKI